MLRLRISASIVSLLSLATVILAMVVGAWPGVTIALLAAAACLAIVAPFDAPNPPERIRVMIACLTYLAALMAALMLLQVTVFSRALAIAIVALLQCGIVLACWAFATRNRRRLPHSRRYFDN